MSEIRESAGLRGRPVHVLICGEELRGDDGAAIRAANLIPTDVRGLAEWTYVGQLGVEALLDLPEGAAVIVADAAVGVEPGAVVVRLLEQVALAGGAAPASSHGLPPEQILALAAEIRGELPRGVFVGIGGSDFGFGERLSAPVETGLAAFASALANEIRRLAADSSRPDPSESGPATSEA